MSVNYVAPITRVKNSQNKTEALVFLAKGGYFFLDARSAAPPVGPFRTREVAEASADINVEIDRAIDKMLAPKVLAARNLE